MRLSSRVVQLGGVRMLLLGLATWQLCSHCHSQAERYVLDNANVGEWRDACLSLSHYRCLEDVTVHTRVVTQWYVTPVTRVGFEVRLTLVTI